MTDWSEVRRELHEPLGGRIGPVDLNAVIRDGRRLRWRRRLSVAGAAVAVLAAGVTAPVLSRADPPAGPAASSAPAGVAAPAVPVGPAASGSGRSEDAGAAGDLIRTGAGDGRVFLMERDDDGRLRLTTGRAMGASVVEQGVAAAVTEGVADRAPGFHLLSLPGEESLVFGYHVGRAWRITAAIDGIARTAVLQAWREDPDVVVFWFPEADSDQPVVQDLSAFDADGRALPAEPDGRPSPTEPAGSLPPTGAPEPGGGPANPVG